MTNSNRIAGELNGLLGDLQFARAEAIKEGRTVTVCVSTDGANCANSTTWQSGWIVFSDPTNVGVVDVGETILRVQATFSSSDTFIASNNVAAITFNREGYAIGMANGTLHHAARIDQYQRLDPLLVDQPERTDDDGTIRRHDQRRDLHMNTRDRSKRCRHRRTRAASRCSR